MDPSFYVSIKIHLIYDLDADTLDSLMQKLERRDSNRLNHYLRVKMNYFLDKKVSEFYQSDVDLPKLQERLEVYFQSTALSQFQKEFQKEGIHFSSLIPLQIFVPDPEYYRSMLASSERILENKLKRIQTVNDAHARKAASEITDFAYFSRLNKMGKLLQRYPSLREYITADLLGANVDVMVMPYDRWFPPSSFRSPTHSQEDRRKQKKQLSSPKGRFFSPQNTFPLEEGLQNENLPSAPPSSRSPSRGFLDLTPP